MSRNPSQTSFTSGEVSARMLSRVDSNVYATAALTMLNFMPRNTGPAMRMPGSTFVDDFTDAFNRGRVINFIDVLNANAVLVLRDNAIDIINTLADRSPSVSSLSNTGFNLQQIIRNPNFDRPGGTSPSEWVLIPEGFNSTDGGLLGCVWREVDFNGVLQCACRFWKYPQVDNTSFLVRQETEVPVPSDTCTIRYRIVYDSNPGVDGEDYTFNLSVGTEPIISTGNVLEQEITGPIGTVTDRTITADLPAGYTGPLYVRFFCTADEFGSTPVFLLDRFEVFTAAEALPPDPPVIVDPTATLYAAKDLNAIQYVQSPYGNKELVLVHPDYPPQWLYYDTTGGNYVFEPIPFVDPPGVWTTNNYPRACTAYQGRLVLAGTPLQSETIWASRTGVWENFSTEATGDPPVVTPDSALEITTIYRSPIQWVYGQKDLLVGTLEYEYVVTSDTGLLQPGDIDVRLQSTHGSGAEVQPISLGKYVLFAAERGTRLRALQRVFQDTGWVAPDFTAFADHITAQGIRRIVYMRNPHQMAVCLLNTGDLGVVHYNEVADALGWSRLRIAGTVEDICSVQNEDGSDLLCLLVRRTINGDSKLYLEVIYDWVYEKSWRYTSCHSVFAFTQPTSVIDGLGYLEGERVQVLGDTGFAGAFLVSGGQIDLTTPDGVPVEVTAAQVGFGMPCLMTLLPPLTDNVAEGGVSSYKRYSDVTVRVAASINPLINGQRPAERFPATPMNQQQPQQILADLKVGNLGTDTFSFVVVSEFVPLAVEVQAVSGKLVSSKI